MGFRLVTSAALAIMPATWPPLSEVPKFCRPVPPISPKFLPQIQGTFRFFAAPNGLSCGNPRLRTSGYSASITSLSRRMFGE
jgi:hypothetical protein